MADQNYTPYSDDWKKEVVKLPKAQIIELFAQLGIENLYLKIKAKNLINQIEIDDYQTADGLHQLKMNLVFIELKNQI
jgi:hypothetical protein